MPHSLSFKRTSHEVRTTPKSLLLRLFSTFLLLKPVDTKFSLKLLLSSTLKKLAFKSLYTTLISPVSTSFPLVTAYLSATSDTMPLIDLDAWDYNYEPPEWFLAHDHGKPIPLVKEEWEHKHDLEGELFKQEHPEMHNPKFISSNKNPNPRPDTGRIDIVEEYRRINGLPDGDQIMRWRDVGRSNPFGAPFAFDSRWDQLGTLVSLTAGCFHKSCLWDGLSETERDWLVSWVPKAEQWVNADKGWYMELWRAVIWRVLWEQLFSPDAPDDAWLGPDWQAFGTLHRSLKSKS